MTGPIPGDFQDYAYSKRRHFGFFKPPRGYPPVDPDFCDLKAYQDLLAMTLLAAALPPGAKVLEIGGGESRVAAHYGADYEIWNLDPLEGSGAGPREVSAKGAFRLVRDAIGAFSRELPEGYFDLVLSISVLEHLSDAGTHENILADMRRVAAPGAPSLHLVDEILSPGGAHHPLVELTRRARPLAAQPPGMDEIAGDTGLFTMSKRAYDAYWKPITNRDYADFGRPFSVNLLWREPE